jgi:hypothetical protein
MKIRLPFCLASMVLCLPLVQAQTVTPPKLTQQEFSATVRRDFEKDYFAQLDETAFEARRTKERFPGAEWRLFVFYRTLTWPQSGANATDDEWKAHLDRFQRWVKAAPDSITARVAQGAAWVEYAGKAKVNADNWTDFDGQIGGRAYQERLKQAERALTFDPVKMAKRFWMSMKKQATFQGDTALLSQCPHWYIVRLAIEEGRAWDWGRYNNIYGEAVALEPAYYYLHEAKAAALLPQRHGGKHEWERFADTLLVNPGGSEGAIAYYRAVTHVRGYFRNNLMKDNFFQEHFIAWPRLLESYKQLEATYSVTIRQLNEIALLASLAREHAVAQVYFDRIGENHDLAVWQEKATFDAYRNMAVAKTAPKKASQWMEGPPNDRAPGKPVFDSTGFTATLTSATAIYARSQDVRVEARIENPANQAKTAHARELSFPALTLVISDARTHKTVMMLPPPAGETQTLQPGQSVRVTYPFNFTLPPGEYTIKMKSLPSNEVLIRIGAARRR